MTRVLVTLATFSVILMLTALTLGLYIGDLYAPRPTEETLNWATVHRLTGIAAALSVVFVESVIVTYFIGTTRWCKEVVETYDLDRTAVAQSYRLKRRTFPWALGGMLAVVAVIALGGAADPATGRANTAEWAQWHFAGAIAGILFIAWTYVAAWNNIYANHAIIERIVAEVSRIRHERGWSSQEVIGQKR